MNTTARSKENSDKIIESINNIKQLFTQSLNQYLVNFGFVQEQASGLFGGYKNHYYISAKNDAQSAITPNEHFLFLKTLQQAASLIDYPILANFQVSTPIGVKFVHPKKWGSTINLELSVKIKNAFHAKNLTLDEIIDGLQRVPLSTNYSMTSIITGVAAAAAIATGAYFAYSALSNSSLPQNNQEYPAVLPQASTPDDQQLPENSVTTPEPTILAQDQNNYGAINESDTQIADESASDKGSSLLTPKNIAIAGTALTSAALAHPRTRAFASRQISNMTGAKAAGQGVEKGLHNFDTLAKTHPLVRSTENIGKNNAAWNYPVAYSNSPQTLQALSQETISSLPAPATRKLLAARKTPHVETAQPPVNSNAPLIQQAEELGAAGSYGSEFSVGGHFPH